MSEAASDKVTAHRFHVPASETAQTKAPAHVAAMFNVIAKRYDLVNTVVSFGRNRGWRRHTTAAINPGPGEQILDAAGGTGSSAAPLAAAGAVVTVCDISDGMIAVGRRRYPEIQFIVADAGGLPFEAETFDKVTVTFGIRNMPNPPKVLAELARVTKPNGKLVICEFSQPTNYWLRKVYPLYLEYVLPVIAGAITRDRGAYTYFANTIVEWPNQVQFARLIKNNGWHKVGYRNLTGGIVAIHWATR